MFRGNVVALTAGVPGYGVLGVCRKLGVWKTRDLSRKRVVDKGKKIRGLRGKHVFFAKMRDVSRFAYKSIRLHRGRFAYRPKSFRLHDLSRFAYIQVVSPTLLSRNIL